MGKLSLSEYTQLYEESYSSFARLYAQRNPPPQTSRWTLVGRVAPYYAMIGLLIFELIAAMIVSGTRTAHTFGSIGLWAFFMLEVGSIVAAVLFARFSTEAGAKHGKELITILLIVTGVVMLSANISDVFFPKAAEVSDVGAALATAATDGIEVAGVPVRDVARFVLEFLISISAPVITMIAGHALMMEFIRAGAASRDIYARAADAERVWREGLNEAWKTEAASFGLSTNRLSKTVIVSKPELDSGFDRQTDSAVDLDTIDVSIDRQTSEESTDRQTDRPTSRQTGRQTSRQTATAQTDRQTGLSKLDKAIAWFEANPDKLDVPARLLESEIDAKKDVILAARKRVIERGSRQE